MLNLKYTREHIHSLKMVLFKHLDMKKRETVILDWKHEDNTKLNLMTQDATKKNSKK